AQKPAQDWPARLRSRVPAQDVHWPLLHESSNGSPQSRPGQLSVPPAESPSTLFCPFSAPLHRHTRRQGYSTERSLPASLPDTPSPVAARQQSLSRCPIDLPRPLSLLHRSRQPPPQCKAAL